MTFRNRKNTEPFSTKLSDTREKKKLADDVTKTADRENSGRKKKNTKAKGEVKAEETNLEKFCKAGNRNYFKGFWTNLMESVCFNTNSTSCFDHLKTKWRLFENNEICQRNM